MPNIILEPYKDLIISYVFPQSKFRTDTTKFKNLKKTLVLIVYQIISVITIITIHSLLLFFFFLSIFFLIPWVYLGTISSSDRVDEKYFYHSQHEIVVV